MPPSHESISRDPRLIIVDFLRAFDLVDYSILLEWFKVIFPGEHCRLSSQDSCCGKVIAGVLKGWVSPTLFNVLFNDIDSCCSPGPDSSKLRLT